MNPKVKLKSPKVNDAGATLAAGKREELKTYRELKLGRHLKSARQRRRLTASGKQRVLGDGSSQHPYLTVDAARYRKIRLEQQRKLLIQAKDSGISLPIDRLLGQLSPRIEALTYAQMAEEACHESEKHLPVAALGRALTSQERIQFADSRAHDAQNPAGASGKTVPRAANISLEQVLGQIEQRQSHNPARYQTIWAQLIGPDAAVQSHLEQVDSTTGIAYFRCYNSVLSSDLQRRPGLAAKLSRALGIPVRQLRARF